MTYSNPEWKKYGLSVPHAAWDMGLHDLVVNYLERHPEIEQKYRPDQTGEIKYFDVLALADM